MRREKRKLKIYREEVKQRHTSHWDWDCMTREEIDSAFNEAEESHAAANKSVAARIGSKILSWLRGRTAD